jgi:hypothetical protein
VDSAFLEIESENGCSGNLLDADARKAITRGGEAEPVRESSVAE